MKVLSILVLLCSTAPALGDITFCLGSGDAAAEMAVIHINEHHDHGYKFNLSEIKGNKVEVVEGGCNIELKLDLEETKCHVVNPKSHQDCELRADTSVPVVANCTVMMSMKDDEAHVDKYDCDTRRKQTTQELLRMCPDCPILLSLNSTDFMISTVLDQFNQNTSNQHYYALQEVGRIKSGYMFTAGMGYFIEFVLVETHCPRESRILREACNPLCSDRAHHAFCKATYTTVNGLRPIDCEFYLPKNTTALEKEPVCPRPQTGGGGPPQVRGPPPGNDGQSDTIPVIHHHSPPCNGVLKDYDRALHPICPWPLPGRQLGPRPSES